MITTYNENKQLVEELKRTKIKIKHYPLQSFSLLVKDRTESQIVIKDPKLKEERVVLHIKNNDLSQAHTEYFNTIWKKAIPA